MSEQHWQPVVSFGSREGTEAFRHADTRAGRLGLQALRFRSGSGDCALVVPFGEFCGGEPTETARSLEPSFERVVARSDGLVFLSQPSAIAALDGLLAAVVGQGPTRALPRWLALPASWGWGAGAEAGDNPQVGPSAGRLELQTGPGPADDFAVHPLSRATAAQQLRLAGSLRKIPEGPDNLQQREEWFRERSGRKG